MLKDSTIDLFGYEISNRGLNGDVEFASQALVDGHKPIFMACSNPHSLVTAAKDEEFQEALRHTDLLVPDGAGILLAARALGTSIPERVAGFEFFLYLTQNLAKRGGARYFFLGSTNVVLSHIVDKMQKEFPEIAVCGTYSPPYKETFSDAENAAMVEAINDTHPDVLWVGMTAPKQEKWIYKHRDSLNVPFIGAIGAVFDFYAGTKKRTSPFWQKMGLEWLPRLLREPRRLWRRNLVSTPIFLYWVAKEKLRQLR